jgi:hypothetical protein
VGCGVSDGDCDCDYDCGYGLKHAQGMRSDTHTHTHAMSSLSTMLGGTDVEASFSVVGNVPVGVLTVERPEAAEQR